MAPVRFPPSLPPASLIFDRFFVPSLFTPLAERKEVYPASATEKNASKRTAKHVTQTQTSPAQPGCTGQGCDRQEPNPLAVSAPRKKHPGPVACLADPSYSCPFSLPVWWMNKNNDASHPASLLGPCQMLRPNSLVVVRPVCNRRPPSTNSHSSTEPIGSLTHQNSSPVGGRPVTLTLPHSCHLPAANMASTRLVE